MTSPAATRRSRLDLTTRSLQPTQVRIAGIPGTCRLARVAMTSLSLPPPRVSGYAREPGLFRVLRRRTRGRGHGRPVGGDRRVGPNVDAPAGEPGRQPGVLALLADRQRQ